MVVKYHSPDNFKLWYKIGTYWSTLGCFLPSRIVKFYEKLHIHVQAHIGHFMAFMKDSSFGINIDP